MICIANPVSVDAHRIAEVVLVVQTGKRRTFLVLHEQAGRTALTADVIRTGAPRRGDVFVTQANGERQIMPPEVFEARYTHFSHP